MFQFASLTHTHSLTQSWVNLGSDEHADADHLVGLWDVGLELVRA